MVDAHRALPSVLRPPQRVSRSSRAIESTFYPAVEGSPFNRGCSTTGVTPFCFKDQLTGKDLPPFASQKLALQTCCLSTHGKPDRLPQERKSTTFRRNKAFSSRRRITLTHLRVSRFSSRRRRPRSSRLR